MLVISLKSLKMKNIMRILLLISVMAVLRVWVVFLAAPAEMLRIGDSFYATSL